MTRKSFLAVQDIHQIKDDVIKKKDNGEVQVYLRIRPPIDPSFIRIASSEEIQVRKTNLKTADETQSFTFTKVFDENAAQETIFDECIRKRVLTFLNGDSTVFMAHGSSGSGKTYTLHGKKNEPGIITRYLEYVFSTFDSIDKYPKLKPVMNFGAYLLSKSESEEEVGKRNAILKQTSDHASFYHEMTSAVNSSKAIMFEAPDYFSIWISFVEIYNENIYDLFSDKKTNLKIKWNQDKEPYIDGVNLICVSNSAEAFQLLMYGLKNLSYASTNINSHSSRSHSLFTIYLVQEVVENENRYSKISKMTFCDLAGCERVQDSKNVGVRLVESRNINRSLFTFKRCFDAILKKRKNLNNCTFPYRESKLTTIIHNALIGRESLTLIVTISSLNNYQSITLKTLEFSAIAITVLKSTKRFQEIKLKADMEAAASAASIEAAAKTKTTKTLHTAANTVGYDDNGSSSRSDHFKSCENLQQTASKSLYLWNHATHADFRNYFNEMQRIQKQKAELEKLFNEKVQEFDKSIPMIVTDYAKLKEKQFKCLEGLEDKKETKDLDAFRAKNQKKITITMNELKTLKKLFASSSQDGENNENNENNENGENSENNKNSENTK